MSVEELAETRLLVDERLQVALDAVVVPILDLGVRLHPIVTGADVREQDDEPRVVVRAEQPAQLGKARLGDVVLHEGVRRERDDPSLLSGSRARKLRERLRIAKQVRGARRVGSQQRFQKVEDLVP